MPGWNNDLVYVDMFHCIYKGHGNDLAGSILHQLALRGLFGQGTPAVTMDAAYTLFRAWCRLHKVNAVHLDSFASCIPATRNEYPLLGGKARYNNHDEPTPSNQPKNQQTCQPNG